MAGRFVIRVDYSNGGFHYLVREGWIRKSLFIGKKAREMWLMVVEPKDATRFWKRETAESAALVLAALDKMNHKYSVREWDGNRERNP